jgi:hypothetical protein
MMKASVTVLLVEMLSSLGIRAAQASKSTVTASLTG